MALPAASARIMPLFLLQAILPQAYHKHEMIEEVYKNIILDLELL